MFIINSESYLKLDNVDYIHNRGSIVEVTFGDGRKHTFNFPDNVVARKYFKEAIKVLCDVDVDNIPDSV